LKYLNLLVRSFWYADVDLSKIKLKQIFFTLENGRIKEWSFLISKNFLKQFSFSLICLSLNLNQIETNDQFQFNGITLQQQFLESMIQLKTFHLYAQFDQEPNDVENLLSTFENQFWLSHQWSMGIHGKYLYTLPFHFDKLEDFIDFDHIKSKMLNSPSTWSHVTSMNLSKYADLNSNFTKQLKMKMPNLRSITFNFEPMDDLYTNPIDTKLDSITTVHCEGEYLQNIKQWLINILPNVKHLVLSYSPQPTAPSSKRTVFIQKLDAYFRGERMTRDYIYFSVEIKLQLKDLDDLYKHVLRLIRELLEMCKNLQYFIFQFYSIDRYSRSEPFTDLTKMIQLLNMDKISKKYQIKHIQNYFQFIKKDNE
jgi:hypothetical protein